MTWPTLPMPAQAHAILLLPSGHRAFDADFPVPIPTPRSIDHAGAEHGVYWRVHQHDAGLVDDVTRVLYVLGGAFQHHGYGREDRHDPDEAHDQ